MPSSFDILYEAATEALVSVNTGNSTFEKIAQQGYVIGNYADLKKDLEETEVHVKKDFELKTMPGPWRSAKSVVLTALSMSIKLTDDNGNFLGKSALQALIKANKEVKVLDEQQYLSKIYHLTNNIPKNLSEDAILRAIELHVHNRLGDAALPF